MNVSINVSTFLEEINDINKKNFTKQKNILSFEEYLDLFMQKTTMLTRNSAEYIKDMIDYFGIEEYTLYNEKKKHYKIFDICNNINKTAIIGQETAHENLYVIIEQFIKQGKIDKLLMLHGPNGSSKSSTAEAISIALEKYSATDEGAIYKFSWIFPTDKVSNDGLAEEVNKKRIGLSTKNDEKKYTESFAHLNEEDIYCKIISELKENPLFLLNKSERIDLYKKALGETANIPNHLITGALASKNKKIYDTLFLTYRGNIKKILQHIQVERFIFSARYRVGIATVEPQLHIDAQDKQLTLEKNLQNIPPVLQNIRLFEPSGELIDANRGFIEFSDLLKRPLDAYKYLLTTVENMSLNLTSGTADLDLLMIASSNEKHLDAFKNTPDWQSFKGRIELIRVPYLLNSHNEEKIYKEDIDIIAKTKKIAPHALSCLARFAVLTRLHKPDTETYTSTKIKNLISNLSPLDKLALYNDEKLSKKYTEKEEQLLKQNVHLIRKEGQSSNIYEGRFGASPRELKSILYFSSQISFRDSLSALSIFEEIEKLLNDVTLYDYLQFESQNDYHNCKFFLDNLKKYYLKMFWKEFLESLNIFEEGQYLKSFENYLQHVFAFIKKEKMYNDITKTNEDPDEQMMTEIENLLESNNDKLFNREKLVTKLASWKLENPSTLLNITTVFNEELTQMSKNIYLSQKINVDKIVEIMLTFETDNYKNSTSEIKNHAEKVFENMKNKFGYTKYTIWETLIFSAKNNFNVWDLVLN